MQNPKNKLGKSLMIFTEIIGCAEVGKIAIKSFHLHHNDQLHIFATKADIDELGDIATHKNNRFVDVTDNKQLLQLYAAGHRGTAWIFASVFSGAMYPEYDNIIHFDSDVYFKDECVSLITNAFEAGIDIAGSKRCYVNNPSHIPVQPGTPDAVSTYFYGMKRKAMPKQFSFDQLVDMYSGHPIGLHHEVFDFADCITFHALKMGAQIMYINSNLIGGQNDDGSKANFYATNLHMDCGAALIHFGGAGSGCAYYKSSAGKNEDYGKWAVIRYALFCYIFLRKEIIYGAPVTKFDAAGRWVSGCYNDEIIETILNDL